MRFKKPIFWDYKKPNILSILLLPLTLPIIINNFFLGLKNIKSINDKPKKICVGNIYVGGTSKTPLTIKLYKIFTSQNIKTATIKKSYKDQIDEQIILKKNTNLYCLKNRKKALEIAKKNNMDVVIFDDGLQDHSLNYDLKFVCFDQKKWIGNGQLIPAGPLREKIRSISKYDAIFINGLKKNNENLKIKIKEYNKKIKIFESFYNPTNINEFNIDDKYLIFSGIGNPENFKEILTKHKLNIVKEIIFPDHYEYTSNDINKIKIEAKNLNAKIITTEKDYVKIKEEENDIISFLKIELEIINQNELIEYLKPFL
ncbi:tetraacyldisaccharide 4'-kinase [Candidatus Pelagibacter sp. Uisw_134_02]|uniref:tetraacyldisaccharide 4'-kinase n=1 Tax=Candidatus Pelagibacter sp. Uisw_134_02 TaxID=3230990 RepID=UPI0039EAC9D3|tara:strand:+ start:233 stop:1174 length:942 start_codon:yes stop_codon:yes gene_type:complete